MVWPSAYHVWIIREMYEKKNYSGAVISEGIRRTFKRSRCFRGYEELIREDQVHKRLR
jgi:hypothetical protein